MTWMSGIIVFVIIWWMVLFMVLPFGVRTPEESNTEPGPGHAPSAPIRPRIGLKFALTTAVTVVLWGVYFVVAANDLLNVRAFLR
jgi:predicted secreted protein